MIKGCIFELGGTLVDKYSLTPIISLKEAFHLKHIIVPKIGLQKYMGMNKLDHIGKILEDKIIINQWKIIHGRHPNEDDKIEIYNYFNKLMFINKTRYMEIIPQTHKCLKYLKDRNIKIGITSELAEPLMNSIITSFNLDQYIDAKVSATCLDNPPRHTPYMIQYTMEKMEIGDPYSILKIDNTSIGIQEGINANCVTVGVSRWSVNMDIESIEESYLMNRLNRNNDINNLKDYYNYNVLKDKLDISRTILKNSQASYIIRTLEDLPEIF
jgi:phosphonoacetaldehyde hydrolase